MHSDLLRCTSSSPLDVPRARLRRTYREHDYGAERLVRLAIERAQGHSRRRSGIHQSSPARHLRSEVSIPRRDSGRSRAPARKSRPRPLAGPGSGFSTAPLVSRHVLSISSAGFRKADPPNPSPSPHGSPLSRRVVIRGKGRPTRGVKPKGRAAGWHGLPFRYLGRPAAGHLLLNRRRRAD